MIDFIDQLSEKTGRFISWISSLLLLSVFLNVVLRYLFDGSLIWLSEFSWHLFAAMFLLGAAYTLKHDRHVRVDVFYSRFGPKGKAIVNLLGNCLFLIPFCLLIIRTAYPYALRSWTIGEHSPEPGGLPALYLIKFAIIIGFVLLLIQAVSMAVRSLLVLTQNRNGLNPN